VIVQFLREHADAAEAPIIAAWGRLAKHGRQILPGEHNMDGFFYARLLKSPAC
jgi:16S rRNA (cytosine967-C5)-methyltransferase